MPDENTPVVVHPEAPEKVDVAEEPKDIAFLAAEVTSHASASSLERIASGSNGSHDGGTRDASKASASASKTKPGTEKDPQKTLIDVVVANALTAVMSKVLDDEKQRSNEFLVTSVVREVTDNAIRRSRRLLREQASYDAKIELPPAPSDEEVRSLVAEAVKRTVSRLKVLEQQRETEQQENTEIAEILRNLPVNSGSGSGGTPRTPRSGGTGSARGSARGTGSKSADVLKNTDFRKGGDGKIDLHHIHNNILGRADKLGKGDGADKTPRTPLGTREQLFEQNYNAPREPRSPQNYLKRGEGISSGAKYYPKIHYPKTRPMRPKSSHDHPFLSRRKKLWLAPQLTVGHNETWHQSLARVPPKATAKRMARAGSASPSKYKQPAPPDMEEFPFGHCDLRCELSQRYMLPFGSENIHGSLKKMPGPSVWSIEETKSLFPLRESERSCVIRCLRPRGVEPEDNIDDPNAEKWYLYSEGNVLRLNQKPSVFIWEGFADGVYKLGFEHFYVREESGVYTLTTNELHASRFHIVVSKAPVGPGDATATLPGKLPPNMKIQEEERTDVIMRWRKKVQELDEVLSQEKVLCRRAEKRESELKRQLHLISVHNMGPKIGEV